MKFVSVIVACFLLASCATPQIESVIVTKPEVVIPPVSLMRCGDVKLPNSFKSDKDVAGSYIKLWKHNHFCHNNVEAIKKYLDNAQKDIDSSPK